MAAGSPLVREIFGRLSDGSVVECVHGKDAFEANIITYYAAVQAPHVPDRDGQDALKLIRTTSTSESISCRRQKI